MHLNKCAHRHTHTHTNKQTHTHKMNDKRKVLQGNSISYTYFQSR